MANEPSVIVFDVNETLSDMAPMRDRFAQIGARQTMRGSGSPRCSETGLP